MVVTSDLKGMSLPCRDIFLYWVMGVMASIQLASVVPGVAAKDLLASQFSVLISQREPLAFEETRMKPQILFLGLQPTFS